MRAFVWFEWHFGLLFLLFVDAFGVPRRQGFRVEEYHKRGGGRGRAYHYFQKKLLPLLCKNIAYWWRIGSGTYLAVMYIVCRRGYFTPWYSPFVFFGLFIYYMLGPRKPRVFAGEEHEDWRKGVRRERGGGSARRLKTSTGSRSRMAIPYGIYSVSLVRAEGYICGWDGCVGRFGFRTNGCMHHHAAAVTQAQPKTKNSRVFVCLFIKLQNSHPIPNQDCSWYVSTTVQYSTV